MNRSLLRTGFLCSLCACALLLLGGLTLSCGDGLFQTPAEPVVRALYNPADGEVPTPTDLVRDEEMGRLDLPIDDDESAAEVYFRRYLNRLDGYPLQSTIRIPFDGEIDLSSAAGAVLVLDASDESRIQTDVSFDVDSNVLQVRPRFDTEENRFLPGRTYVVGLRGYGGGIQGISRQRVVADAAFHFLRAQEDLREHVYAMPGNHRSDKVEAADALETIRQSMLPFQDMVVRRGIERAELAVVSSFTTTSLPSIWFDPAQGEIPVPNGVLIDEDTGLVDLPLDDEDTEKQRELKEALSHYDGFSTSAAIVFEATQAVESETLTSAENLRLFRLETGGTVREVIDVDRGVLGDGRGFFIRPRVPMEPKSHYVAVATRGIRAASGMALEAQPLSALLSSPTPLLIDGTAQVSILTVDEATRLEPWRELARPVVEFLSMESIPPEEIAAIAPFRTLTVAEKLLEQREQLFAKVSARISNVVVRSPSQRGVSLVMPAVETVVTGSFLTRDRLDPRTHRFFENDTVLDTSVPFVLTIPDGVQPGQKIPVVLFGHGLFTSRELVYMIAQTLASAGYAAFAIDFPYHGLRTLCREDLECQGDARCTEFGQCELPDGTLGPLNSIQSPWPDGPSWPAATGAYFIDPDNIVGSRDHFFQAVVDLFQALRVIKENDWAGEWGFSLDTEDVVYMGMSLGAIVGSVFAGVEPQVTTFVLNAGGGDFYRMLSDSAAFESMFDRVLRDQDIVLGTDDAFQFENGLRWLLDSIDPINLAHHATVDPLTYRDPQDGMMKTAPLKRLLLQMAEGDSVVPNSSSRALSERTGVPLRIYSPLISNHAFLFDPTSLEGARARQDAIDFFGAR